MNERTNKALSIGLDLFFISIMAISTVTMGYVYGAHANVVTTTGDSMQPNITKGDVLICNERYANLSVGDIASYDPPYLNYSVTHKVDSRNVSHYRFKGINNDVRDGYPVTRERINCKVSKTLHTARYYNILKSYGII